MTMTSKKETLDALGEMLGSWETLLDNLSVEQITAPQLADGWSIKDVVAHLMAWQQVTNARLDAALSGLPPTFPDWFYTPDAEAEGDPNETNAKIFDLYHHQPWPAIYSGWQQGYQRVLHASEAIPEADLFAPGRYPFMGDYPLAAVLEGTLGHHAEHMDTLRDRLNV